MSKVAHYLQEHLIGEVLSGTDARRYFSTDASALQLPPALVVYPRNEQDVRKTARFTWQLAERGRVIPITARGNGTDETGAALSSGISLIFPAHMNRILELDTKSNSVSVEAGINYGKLQQALTTHGRILPSAPVSAEYSTIGGAIANNASGPTSYKYGDTRAYVQSLRVVLANGEVIETSPLSKRDLSRKLGLATFEGEIYRQLDTLLEENQELIDTLRRPGVSKDNAGYYLSGVKQKDGSIDLTPLFVGSQGTLGIITEATLTTDPVPTPSTLVLAAFNEVDACLNTLTELHNLSHAPASVEFVNGEVIAAANKINPNLLTDILPEDAEDPFAILLIELDEDGSAGKKQLKNVEKALEEQASTVLIAADPEERQKLLAVREASGMIISHNDGLVRSVPLLSGAAVPVDQLPAYFVAVEKLFKATNTPLILWGHAGDGIFHLQPRLNLAQVGDRQKAFRLLDDYNKIVMSLGGTISSETGDGRLHTPYLEAQLGAEAYALLRKVKEIFDPYEILNPGVKFDTSIDDLKSIIRPDFAVGRHLDHLPRS